MKTAPKWFVPRQIWVSERVAFAFFVYTLTASWFFSIGAEERLKIASINLLAASVILLMNRFGPRGLISALRNWLPCALIILAYRESGLFLSPDVTHSLDNLFVVWDRALLGNAIAREIVALYSPFIDRFFELAYLLTYPFVPLGFAAIYLRKEAPNSHAGIENVTDRFWTTVLLAVLTSYALFPYFPLTPPRVLFQDLVVHGDHPLLRQTNLWVLDRFSVQACLFPSGHVAGAVATALAVRAERPRLGALFMFAAASIAAATVYGRYHYFADAVAGALVGVAAYAVSSRIHQSSAKLPTSS